jgi:streptogramin lyase
VKDSRRARITGRAGLVVAAALAAAVGAGVAASLPAAAQIVESPVVQVFPVPANLLPAQPGVVTDAALAAAADGTGEQFIVSAHGAGTVGLEVTAAGQMTAAQPAPALGTQPFVAVVQADGYDWALSDGGLYAIGTDGGVHAFAVPAGQFTDMTLGLDSKLYLADHAGNIDQCAITPGPSATCAIPMSVESRGFQSTQPDAIATAGANLWFTTGDNTGFPPASDVGSVSTAGTFGGPYPAAPGGNLTDVQTGLPVAAAWTYPHSIVLGRDGNLYAVGSNEVPTDSPPDLDGNPDAIAQMSADTGHISSQPGLVLKYFSTGLPAGVALTSLTTGPDGDLWFTEELPGAGGQIGQLDPATGAIANYPLPAGYALAGAGADAIAPGPAGSATVWFAAQTTASPAAPAIGEVSGLAPPPPPPAMTTTTPPPTATTATTATPPPPPVPHAGVTIVGAVRVAANGRAAVKLRCAGTSGARCVGRLALTRIVTETVTVNAGRHRHHQSRRKRVALGASQYRLATGAGRTVQVKLTSAAIAMLAVAPRGRLPATATATASEGSGATAPVTLTSPLSDRASSKRRGR